MNQIAGGQSVARLKRAFMLVGLEHHTVIRILSEKREELYHGKVFNIPHQYLKCIVKSGFTGSFYYSEIEITSRQELDKNYDFCPFCGATPWRKQNEGHNGTGD